jgi:hypothetical protein
MYMAGNSGPQVLLTHILKKSDFISISSPKLFLKKTLMAVLAIFFFYASGTQAQAATTYFVDGVNGNDNNACTAQNAACQTISGALGKVAEGDTVKIGPATYQELVLIPLNNLILEGTGQKASDVVISQGLQNGSDNVTVRNLTIKSDGNVGLLSSGNMTVEKTIITGKNSSGSCGGGIRTISPFQFRQTLLTLKNSTITGSTTLDNGAAICASAPINIINSTISGNEAIGSSDPSDPNVALFTGMGGAIYVWGGDVRIYNSTIANNKAKNHGGALMASSGTGYNLTLDNSILSGNTSNGVDENCNANNIITGGSFNIENGNTCSDPNNPSFFTLHSDPKLDSLNDNGGPTSTQALLAGSPAIDAGDPNGCKGPGNVLLSNDQRGQQRVGRCDMGSFEYVPPGWKPPPTPSPSPSPIAQTQNNPPTSGQGGTGTSTTTTQGATQTTSQTGSKGSGGCSLNPSSMAAGYFWIGEGLVLITAGLIRFRKK